MIETLEQLYLDQIRDLHSAETQLLELLPELATLAHHPELREAFARHSEETNAHLSRLNDIAYRHGIDAGNALCEAMNGLVKEARKHAALAVPGAVRDAVLIASANRIEHYEIAGYGVAKAFADSLGFAADSDLLAETLEEEGNADRTLTKIATGGIFESGVNEAASQER